MFRRTLKAIVFAILVLLLGQVSVGEKKIGEIVLEVAVRGCDWGRNQVTSSAVYAQVSQWEWLTRWVKKKVELPQHSSMVPMEDPTLMEDLGLLPLKAESSEKQDVLDYLVSVGKGAFEVKK